MFILYLLYCLYLLISPSSPVTEEKNDDTVTLNCSVSTSDWCFHTVKWLYEGHKSDLKTEQVDCSATATFTSHLNQKSEYYELLKCEVKHSKFVHLFTFSPPQSPGENMMSCL